MSLPGQFEKACPVDLFDHARALRNEIPESRFFTASIDREGALSFWFTLILALQHSTLLFVEFHFRFLIFAPACYACANF
jgi:hypothetical protein